MFWISPFNRSLAAFGLIFSTTMLMADTSSLPVTVSAQDTLVRYVGRFDTRDAAGPRCAWSASTVAMKFHGTALNAKIADQGYNFWQVVIDGKPAAVLPMQAGEHLYTVAEGLKDGDHTIELLKATEGALGISQFTGFQLSEGGRLLPVEARKHRLEVIGDSISCGFGNMAASAAEHFSPQTENAFYSYGAIAARAVEADYVCVAFSGRKMWPDNTTPELYDRSLTLDSTSQWDFAKFTPEAIVINLATNDFGGGAPDEAGWTGAYEAFIRRLRQHAPKARIYCAMGTMMTDRAPGQPVTVLRHYLEKIAANCKAAGDEAVSIIDFGEQDPANGIGAGMHPSKKTHELMGEQLAKTLRKDLGW